MMSNVKSFPQSTSYGTQLPVFTPFVALREITYVYLVKDTIDCLRFLFVLDSHS